MSASETQRPARLPDNVVEECERQYWNHLIHERRRRRRRLERSLLPDDSHLGVVPPSGEEQPK